MKKQMNWFVQFSKFTYCPKPTHDVLKDSKKTVKQMAKIYFKVIVKADSQHRPIATARITCNLSGFLPVIVTFAPSLANKTAVALPIPLLEPKRQLSRAIMKRGRDRCTF